MTPTEIQMLLVGAALGAQGMTLLHIIWSARDCRRHEVAARRHGRILAADQYLNSLRLYRLQNRTPA